MVFLRQINWNRLIEVYIRLFVSVLGKCRRIQFSLSVSVTALTRISRFEDFYRILCGLLRCRDSVHRTSSHKDRPSCRTSSHKDRPSCRTSSHKDRPSCRIRDGTNIRWISGDPLRGIEIESFRDIYFDWDLLIIWHLGTQDLRGA